MFDYGKIKSYKTVGNEVSIEFENIVGKITVVTEDIINVFAPHESEDHRSKAIEGDKYNGAKFEVAESDGAVCIKTDKLEAKVYDGYKVDFYDRDGKMLCRDYRGKAENSASKNTLDAAQIAAREAEGHKIDIRKKYKIEVFKQIDGDECFYGLGEKTGYLNKRGYDYEMWNTDNASPHVETFRRLYKSLPFFITLKNDCVFGLFFDNTYLSSFDMATANADYYRYGVNDGNLDYYFIGGENMPKIVENYTYLTGRMNLPQLWTLGYHQSRWGYITEDDFREVADGMRKNDIPCDVLHYDIDYMDGFRVFTFDPKHHPDPAAFLAEMKQKGFRAVTIVDPGVKVDTNYSVYNEGLEKGYFAKDAFSGNVYINKVWPGKSAYPDFGNPEVRKWWGENHKVLLDAGADGIWNDMNEPASFEGELPADVIFTDEGRVTNHAEMHNVYGHEMCRATYEGVKKLTGKRPFVLTRACYSGTQKYALVWTGDNTSIWYNLQMAIEQLCNLGLSGMAFAATDIGGFCGNTTPELLTRWIQMACFSPMCRNHCCSELRQEPWVFGEPYLSIYRKFVKLRYKFIPYLYNTFRTCTQTGMPVMRPLVLMYEKDENVKQINDEFMIGDSILVAPVVGQGQTRRMIYLPEGEWYDYITGEKVSGNKWFIREAPIDVCPMYIRSGAILPTFAPQSYIGEIDNDETLYLEVYGENGKYIHYQDNGTDFAYLDGAYNEYEIVNCNGEVSVKQTHTGYEKPYKNTKITYIK